MTSLIVVLSITEVSIQTEYGFIHVVVLDDRVNSCTYREASEQIRSVSDVEEFLFDLQ